VAAPCAGERPSDKESRKTRHTVNPAKDILSR
jgi:hypothetical protein